LKIDQRLAKLQAKGKELEINNDHKVIFIVFGVFLLSISFLFLVSSLVFFVWFRAAD